MYIVNKPDEYLIHYGVKGMKWGVRKDRTSNSRLRTAAKIFSPAGYALATAGIKIGKKGVKKYKAKKAERIEKQRKKALSDSTSGKYTYRQRKKLSNSELQSRINRLSMEKKLKDLAREDSRDFTMMQTGTKEARKALGIYGAKVLLDLYWPGAGKYVKNPNKK